MGKSAWGIDLSKYSMKCVQLVRTKSGIELKKMCVIEYPQEAAGGEEQTVEQKFFEALRQFREQYRIGGSKILFSLPGHSIFNRLVKLPPVEKEKIPEVVRYEAQSQIPFPIEEVIWDYQLVDRPYGPGEEKEAIIFAIKKDIIEQFLESLKPLHVEVDGIQFAPVALYNFLKRDQDTGAPCVAMDMGADNTDLIILDGQKFWIRNLPVTGNDITRSLQKAFSLSFADAEKLKIRAGQSQQVQKIFSAIQPIMKDLVSETHRTIGYYKSISKGVKFDKIFLMGNASKTVNFQKFVSQSLQLQAFRLTRLNNITVSEEIDDGTLQRYLPTMGAAIGLALQGLGETYNTVNLLPRPYLKEKEAKRKRPFVIAAIAALYLLFFLIYRGQSRAVREVERVSNDMQTTLKRHDVSQEECRKVSDKAGIVNRLETIASISRGRDRITLVRFMERFNNILKDRVTDIVDGNGIFKLFQSSDDGRKYTIGDPRLKSKERIYLLGIEAEVTEEIVTPPTPPTPSGAPPKEKEAEKKKDVGAVPAPPPPKNRFIQIAVVLAFPAREDSSKDGNYIRAELGDKIAQHFGLPTKEASVYEVSMTDYIVGPGPVTKWKWEDKDLRHTKPDLVASGLKTGSEFAVRKIWWKIPLGEQVKPEPVEEPKGGAQ